MEDEPLEFEEFCRKTYNIGSGKVVTRYLFEKHGPEGGCWNPDTILRVYNFISDAIQRQGYESWSHELSILAGAESKGGCLVQIDIQGIGLPMQSLRKLHDDVCHYLINIKKWGALAENI